MQDFVVPGSGQASLGMPDIDNLSLMTVNYETIGRQLAADDNADKRSSSIEGRKPESCKKRDR